MTASTGSKRPRRARRWVGAILAVVLLPVGAALLLYSFVLRGDGSETNASPPTSASPSVITVPAASPTPSPGGSASGAPPETSIVVITTYYAVPLPPEPGSGGPDILALVTTISGLLASVAGIVSAIVSARAPRRQ